MKRFAFLLFSLTLTFSLSAQKKSATKTEVKTTKTITADVDGPVMTLETVVMDYGTIEQDSDPYRFFKFTNTGTEPLVIKHAKGSCGCTVPDYAKEPIMPGETSEIKVRYATNRVGPFKKTITLTTNEGDDVKGMKHILTIKGTVTAKAPEPKAIPTSQPSIFSPK